MSVMIWYLDELRMVTQISMESLKRDARGPSANHPVGWHEILCRRWHWRRGVWGWWEGQKLLGLALKGHLLKGNLLFEWELVLWLGFKPEWKSSIRAGSWRRQCRWSPRVPSTERVLPVTREKNKMNFPDDHYQDSLVILIGDSVWHSSWGHWNAPMGIALISCIKVFG